MSGVTSNTARRVRRGGTLPVTCSPGEVFGKTSGGSEGLYFCVTANAWTGPFDTSADSGDVVGPASSTDNAFARFDLTTGKLLQDSLVTADDPGSVNIPSGQTYKINNVALAKGDVGLGNIDNTSDANKPVSTAQQTALDLKANLVSPTFTTPTLGAALATSVNFGGTALSTYLESTSTPALTFGGVFVGGAYSHQSCRYTQIGNFVTATCRVTLTAKGTSTGNAAISLPVNAANVANYNPVGTVFFAAGTGITAPVALVSLGSALLYTAAGTALTDAAFTNTSDVIITVQYRTN